MRTPRLTLSSARKLMYDSRPLLAEALATLAMVIGPLKFFGEISPTIIL